MGDYPCELGGDYKHLKLLTIQIELAKSLEWELKCLQETKRGQGVCSIHPLLKVGFKTKYVNQIMVPHEKAKDHQS